MDVDINLQDQFEITARVPSSMTYRSALRNLLEAECRVPGPLSR
jgi:hypothetical protein